MELRRGACDRYVTPHEEDKMANPGEPEGISAGADQGENLPDMMPRDPDAPADQSDDLNQAGNCGALGGAGLDRRGQPSTAEGAFGAATGSDYGSGAGGGNEQATGGRFGATGTDSDTSSATGSSGSTGA